MGRRPARGIRLSTAEMIRLGVPAEIGGRFETADLDLFAGTYEVLDLNEDGAVVTRVGPRRPSSEDRR